MAFNVASMLNRYLDLDSHVDRAFLRSGTNWRAEIARRIRHSELVIVLLSRVVGGDLAEGVAEEVDLARTLNVPVIFGCIRGYKPELQFQHIDFGEDGRRIEGVWDLAKFLLTESHKFRTLGMDSLHLEASGVTALMGNPERLASRAGRVLVLGHTMKEWLGDYGNAIRHGKASVAMYFPAATAIGLDLLCATHRSGDRIREQIARAKQEALAIERELGDAARFQCFVIPVKPMFSATVIDPETYDAHIIIDHYSYHVGAGARPKLVVRGSSTPLFTHYWKAVQDLTAQATPLESER
jgi:hypothetical protein